MIWKLTSLLVFAYSFAFCQKPNIVVVLLDDLAYETVWSDSTYTGDLSRSKPVEMPFFRDTFPAIGKQYVCGYSAPKCTPSRQRIMTGKHGFRGYHGFNWLHNSQRTFFHNARAEGYSTAMVGKWQLQYYPGIYTKYASIQDKEGEAMRSVPFKLGIQDYFLYEWTREDETENQRWANYKNFWKGSIRGTEMDTLKVEALVNTDYGPDTLHSEVMRYLEDHKSDNNPFFLYYTHPMPHGKHEPTPESSGYPNVGIDNEIYFADYITYLDSQMGEMVQKIRSDPQLKNTVVIITSDNGTPRIPRTIRYKYNGQIYPGQKGVSNRLGTHVPFYAMYFGDNSSIIPGSIDSSLVTLIDVYATVNEIIGSSASPNDGESFAGDIVNYSTSYSGSSKYIYDHYALYGFECTVDNGLNCAAYAHDGKYWLDAHGRFYDSDNDIEMESPITDRTPAQELIYTALDSILKSYPTVNQDRARY